MSRSPKYTGPEANKLLTTKKRNMSDEKMNELNQQIANLKKRKAEVQGNIDSRVWVHMP
mgnify:CR=1 FL=1